METFTVTVETTSRREDVHRAIDDLLPFHGSVGMSVRNRNQAIITIPAEGLAQATTTAIALIEKAFDARAVACEAMTEAEFDTRQGFPPAPTDVMSVTEYAAEAGISRQAVLQRIDAGKLPAVRVGRSWLISKLAVTPGPNDD